MKTKFCGLTRASDVQDAVKLGVDAIGLVFYPPSPRAVTPEQACELIRYIPSYVTVVALVVNMDEAELINLAQIVPFDVLQFHGDKTPAECQRLAKAVNKRWYKALRVSGSNDKTQTAQDIADLVAEFMNAGSSSVLLDAYHKDAYGGTGERFDWSLIPDRDMLAKLGFENGSLILAGGLTSDNVGEAVSRIKTNALPVVAVDVSGGIERERGIKDLNKMGTFVKNIL